MPKVNTVTCLDFADVEKTLNNVLVIERGVLQHTENRVLQTPRNMQ